MAQGKYQEWLTKEGLLSIESWASDGLSNEQIASNMGIGITTLKAWRKKYPSIESALKKGRAPVVRELENALIKKAMGFEYEETVVESWVDDNGKTRKKATKHTKYIPPDSSALMFLLKNYKPNKYRNYNDLTKRQIEADIRKGEAEAKLAENQAEDLTQSETQVANLRKLIMEKVQE